MNNLPPFTFLGYNLAKGTFSRTGSSPLNIIKIMVKAIKPVAGSNVLTFLISADLTFLNGDVWSLTYSSSFKIIDKEWTEKAEEENVLLSVLFSSVFPFIRSSISSMSDDSYGRVDLPIIDLRNNDLSKGIVLKRENNSSIK